ncbi:hypothetical protein [Aestuariivirga sp.]|uniref:hypothetical protein n=1 Tax=Aestuariivirga sp. TaxID=2650926 RepID=UPI0039E4E2EB
MKKLAFAAALAGLGLCTPAFADDWKCDEANLNDMRAAVGQLDGSSKDEGGREVDAAMEAMKANNMEECTLRMTNANKLLGGTNLERRLETAKDKSNNNTDGNNNNNNNNNSNP